MRRHRHGVAVALAACFAAHAEPQTCLQDREPNDALGSAQAVAGAFCIAGGNGGAGQDAFAWSVSPEQSGNVWRLRLQGLPGQTAKLVLQQVAPGADAAASAPVSGPLLQRSSAANSPDVDVPELVVGPGQYLITVGTAGGAGVYRFAVEVARSRTASDTVTGPPPLQTGNFSIDLAPGALEIAVPWRVAGGDARWTVAADAPVDRRFNLSLQDTTGKAVASATPQNGVAQLTDLVLAAADYRLVVNGDIDGVALRVRAETAAASVLEAEPNDDVARAFAIDPARPFEGRLLPTSGPADVDHLAFEVSDAWKDRRVDVVARSPGDVALALLGADGTVYQQRSGPREARLRALTLSPGRYIARVTGALAATDAYSLSFEPGAPAAAGEEREPNDVRPLATPFASGSTLTGTFDGSDPEYLDLGVSGDLQLWEIVTTGERLTRVSVYDAGNNVLASGYPASAGSPVRLSRLLMPPGSTVQRLEGEGGSWSVTARALGPRRAEQEIEPNDDEANAIALVPGRPQTGWLDHTGDVDTYAFHLAAPQHVVLDLTGPAAQPIELRAGWGAPRDQVFRATTNGAAPTPQRLQWDGVLDTGDYVVALVATPGTAPSAEPYRLALDYAPRFFQRPADLERNNDVWQALAPPTPKRLVGRLNGADTDTFKLPEQSVPAMLGITATRVPSSGALAVDVVRITPEGRTRVTSKFLYAAGETAALELPAGSDLALVLYAAGNGGDYELALDAPGLADPLAPLPVETQLQLAATAVAAYERNAQRVTGTFRVLNRGDAALRLDMQSWSGDETWRLSGLPAAVALAARGSVELPVTVEVPPDADLGAVDFEVAVTREGVEPAAARARIEASAGAPVVGAASVDPLPAALLGGLDVAWDALGGVAPTPSAALIDGIVDGAGVRLDASAPPVLDLAGDLAVPVAGVILYPPPAASLLERLADFAVEASSDGATFARVLEARLSPQSREQSFVLPTPVDARAIRVVPRSSYGGAKAKMALAEIKVVASPGFELRDSGFDVALPALGGHIVRTAGFGDTQLTGDGARWPTEPAVRFTPVKGASIEWVLGFMNGRAAEVSRLVWHAPASDVPADGRLREVEVAASVAGPFGPWTELGKWNVDNGTGASQPFAPPAPVWARALRFRAAGSPSGNVTLPQRIEVIEEPRGPSMLGEWGDESARGPYEASLPAAPEPEPYPPVGHTAQTATPLALGAVARGRVQRGQSEDWYSLDLPDGTRALQLRFDGGVAPEVAVTLFDASGRAVDLAADALRSGEVIAPASAGRWTVRVVQPPQSVVVSWDTSISVAPFVPHVTRLVQRIVWELNPEHEQINLLPFGSDRMLMQSWSGEPGDVYGALRSYPWNHTSSDADGSLLAALDALDTRVGTRAVVLVTDAADGVSQAEPVWRGLERSRTKVFALHLPADSDPVRVRQQMNLLRDWSQSGGGFYKRFASQGDAESVFRRMSAWLRKPASYAFTATATSEAPAAGGLTVVRSAPGAGAAAAGPSAAVEIVLDASGSMLQRLGTARRIEVARKALEALATEGVPRGTNVALRVFGQGAVGSCASDVVLPLSPLDTAAFTTAVRRVQPVDGAKTPIGESLRLAGADLAGAPGPKLVVLVTDGEETCDGDPEAEIAKLRAAGLDVRVNIVGFAVDDAALKATFARWAATGSGDYFDAADASALDDALERAVAEPFEVVGADRSVIASGTVGAPLQLPPGTYSVRIGGADAGAVTIRSGETTTIEVAPTR